jgi:uncharacterized RDD family membrane protein YckC
MTTTTTTNPYAPPRAIVRDIADPNVSTELADAGTRLGAAILDGIIMAAMVYVPFLIAVVMGAAAGPDNVGAFMTVGFVLMLVGFVAWAWLTILYVSRNGQSIAKKMLGIKVVRADGSPASLGRIFWMRNFVNGLIGIIPLYGLIDVLFVFSESRQCLHDKLADTIVIKA